MTCKTWFPHQVAVYESDGSRLSRRYRRTVTMDTVTEMETGPDHVTTSRVVMVPDDSIVTYSVVPPEGATRLRVRVSTQTGSLVNDPSPQCKK